MVNAHTTSSSALQQVPRYCSSRTAAGTGTSPAADGVLLLNVHHIATMRFVYFNSIVTRAPVAQARAAVCKPALPFLQAAAAFCKPLPHIQKLASCPTGNSSNSRSNSCSLHAHTLSSYTTSITANTRPASTLGATSLTPAATAAAPLVVFAGTWPCSVPITC